MSYSKRKKSRSYTDVSQTESSINLFLDETLDLIKNGIDRAYDEYGVEKAVSGNKALAKALEPLAKAQQELASKVIPAVRYKVKQEIIRPKDKKSHVATSRYCDQILNDIQAGR